MTYYLRERFGAYAVTRADGTALRAELVPLLKEGAHVTLDFKDVEVVATPFLGASVGTLLTEFSPDHLREHLTFDNLSDDASHLLTRVITSARCALDDMEARTLA